MRSDSLQQFLRNRRSIRRFLPRPVSRQTIERILETAVWAPSAHNRQPWRFVVLDSDESKARLAEIMGGEFRQDLLADGLADEVVTEQVNRSRNRILEAPVVIVLCMDLSEMDTYPDEKRQAAERVMAIQSVALAGGTLLLSAHAEGLGGVWVCAPLFAPKAVRLALGLPVSFEPQAMLLVGYPKSIPDPRPRKPLEAVIRYT